MVTDIINSTQTVVTPRAYQGTSVVTSDNSYILNGGGGAYPFLNYNPQTYTWRTLPVDPSANTTVRNTIVNMGNDIFWIWGGENYPDYRPYIPNIAYVYDYKSSKWINRIAEYEVPWRIEHTATLGLDGGIYVLGGAIRYFDTNFNYSNFNDVMRFDTKSSQWSYFTTTGHSASPRVSHTATQLPNRNQLLVYGGINSDPYVLRANNGQHFPAMDYCIIFDYSNNTFQNIEFPTPPNSVNNRYGHFAELYNETYLVMGFGFIDEKTAATSLSVLNISNPFSPQWVRTFPALPNNTNTNNNNNNTNSTMGPNNDNTSPNNGLSGGIIAAIVVPIVVLILLIASGIFIYFYKKRGKMIKLPKDQFVLDESDPRLNADNDIFNNSINDSVEKSSTNTHVKQSKETEVEDEKYIKPSSDGNDYINISTTDLTGNFVKPSEYLEKPFGNEP
ncbi:hypothetical protein BJ944DRAFT_291533 [Cunninghamella echinulata]|nr:hypothetical protein BJ944DRAFT_291533 [Cunninghamella echinulata]